MIDAHCHVSCGNPEVRELLIGRDCFGTHPWEADKFDEAALIAALTANPQAGVGEIGLDRLHDKVISPVMRAVFERQLAIAAQLGRFVVLHGAKCWGEVCRAATPYKDKIPAFIFHGFSRSVGLLPDIFAINGFISVGPAVLNDHAVNYREMVKQLPLERLLIETDRTEQNAADCPDIFAVAKKVADLRGISLTELEAALTRNFNFAISPRSGC